MDDVVVCIYLHLLSLVPLVSLTGAKRRLRTKLIRCTDAHRGILIAELDEGLTLLAPPWHLFVSHPPHVIKISFIMVCCCMSIHLSHGMLPGTVGTVGQAAYRMVKCLGSLLCLSGTAGQGV